MATFVRLTVHGSGQTIYVNPESVVRFGTLNDHGFIHQDTLIETRETAEQLLSIFSK